MKRTDIKSLLNKHAQEYPKMGFTDGVKLMLQSTFGGAHCKASLEETICAVEKEISSFEADPSLFIFEDAGDYLRLQLKNPPVRDLGPEIIGKLFYMSALEDREVTDEKLLALSEGLQAAEDLFSANEEEKALAADLFESYKKGAFKSVSHSEKYREAYAPSYRIISKKYARLLSLIIEISQLSETKERTVIALDGRCASGKSTAAGILSKLFDAPVIPMDDFFLPFERKTPERLCEAGGNIDYERFSEDIIPNLKKKEAFRYKAYSCSNGGFYEKTVPESKIVIVEGVYSMRDEFFPSFDLTAFFEVSKDTQEERLKKRNPALFERFRDEWIPMEEAYFKAFSVKKRCDITVPEN